MQETTRPEEASAAAANRRRLGNFELVELVSTGESTLVHRGWDPGLARAVAIKEYFPRALARRDADGDVQPVWAEAAALFERGRSERIALWRDLARCHDDALVHVLHVFEAHGTTWAVMPWYEGQLLSALADDGHHLPMGEDALRRLLESLLGALDALQHAGRAHGRLVPTKVLWQGAAAVLLEPAPGAGASAAGLAADLRALAALGRYCITGILPSAAGVPESLAASVEPLAFERLSARYSKELLGVLDVDAAGAGTIESFRHRLHAHAAPASPAAAPPAATEEATAAPDTETAALIRRVLASIPDRIEPAARPPVDATPMFAAHDPGELRDAPAAPAPRRPRSRGWFRKGASLIGIVAIVAGVWKLSGVDLLRVAEDAIPMPTQPTATATATAAATAPAMPTPTPTPTPTPPPAPVPEAVAPPAPVEVPPPAPPAAVEPTPPTPPPRARVPTGPSSPRTACAGRTEFSLYRCMQRQCDLAQWSSHAECRRLRATDTVG